MKTPALILFAASAMAVSGAAHAQPTSPDKDIACRFIVMANMMVCDVRSKWSNSPTALADGPRLTFDEELRVRAREMSEIYVRKGQCDKARKRSLAAGDPIFVEEIERKCAPEPVPQ